MRLLPTLSFLAACQTVPPTLTLLSPQDGDAVCGTPLEIQVEVEDFTLTNESSLDAPPDVGHLHVYLNGQEVAQADEASVPINDIADNVYMLSLDLSGADHRPLDPPVELGARITVDHTLCEE